MIKERKKRTRGDAHAWFLEYKQWATEQKEEPTPEGLRKWDTKHNESRIKKSFGNHSRVYEFGLITLYRLFLYNHSLLSVRGTSISGYRVIGVGGAKGPFIDEATPAQLEFAKAKLANNSLADAKRLLMLGGGMGEIREISEKSWAEAEAQILVPHGTNDTQRAQIGK